MVSDIFMVEGSKCNVLYVLITFLEGIFSWYSSSVDKPGFELLIQRLSLKPSQCRYHIMARTAL